MRNPEKGMIVVAAGVVIAQLAMLLLMIGTAALEAWMGKAAW